MISKSRRPLSRHRRSFPGPPPRFTLAKLARSALTDWIGPVVDVDLEMEEQSLLRGLNATIDGSTQVEGDVIIWRGMRFAAKWSPPEIFDRMEDLRLLSQNGTMPPMFEPTEERWAAILAYNAARKRIDAKDRWSRRGLALAPLALVAGVPALRARALSLPLGLLRRQEAILLLHHAVLGTAFGALFFAQRKVWLREERSALPLVLLDICFVRALGHLVELCIGALAAAGGVPGAFSAAGAAPAGGGVQAARALVYCRLALFVCALREVLTLSCLWWWTDLVECIRIRALHFGKIGRAFRGWHAAATALSVAGLLRIAAELLAPRCAALASIPPLTGFAAAGSAVAVGIWQLPVLTPLRLITASVLARRSVVALLELAGYPWPQCIACFATFLYVSYALLADLISTSYADMGRRLYMPSLTRYIFAVRSPAAVILDALGLRDKELHFRDTRAALRTATDMLSTGSTSPEFMKSNDDMLVGVWRPPSWPKSGDEGEGGEEEDEYERAVGKPVYSTSERRSRRDARKRKQPMMPLIQALIDRTQDDERRVRRWRRQAQQGPEAAKRAEIKIERLRRRFNRNEWTSEGANASVADFVKLAEAFPERLTRVEKPPAYDLDMLVPVIGTDDLRELNWPAAKPQLRTQPWAARVQASSELAQLERTEQTAPSTPLQDAGGSADLRTLTPSANSLPFRPPEGATISSAQRAQVDDEDEADRLALAAAAEAQRWEPEEPGSANEFERRALIFLDPSD